MRLGPQLQGRLETLCGRSGRGAQGSPDSGDHFGRHFVRLSGNWARATSEGGPG